MDLVISLCLFIILITGLIVVWCCCDTFDWR